MKNSSSKVRLAIKRAIFSGSTRMWYIVDRDGDRYNNRYLHCDGVIRHGTSKDVDGRRGYPGWYKTRKLAREAVSRFRTSNI